jgi:hypothetical protein
MVEGGKLTVAFTGEHHGLASTLASYHSIPNSRNRSAGGIKTVVEFYRLQVHSKSFTPEQSREQNPTSGCNRHAWSCSFRSG